MAIRYILAKICKITAQAFKLVPVIILLLFKFTGSHILSKEAEERAHTFRQ